MAGNVETSVDEFHVALLRLNRPEARNALSPEMMEEIADELERLDPDPEVRCIVIAGSDEVFAAGADIRAMAERTLPEALYHPAAGFWRRVAAIKTPLVAARLRLRARRRLRAGARLRHDRRLRDGRSSASPRSRSGSSPAAAAPSASPGCSASSGRWSTCSPAAASTPAWPTSGASSTKSSSSSDCVLEAIELARTIAERPPLAARLAKQAVIAAEETTLARRHRERAPPLRAGDGDRGPGRGDEGLHREARAEVRGASDGRTSSSPSSTRRASSDGFSWRARAARRARPAASASAPASSSCRRARPLFPLPLPPRQRGAADRDRRPPSLRTPDGERVLERGRGRRLPARRSAGAHQVVNRSESRGAGPARQRDERARDRRSGPSRASSSALRHARPADRGEGMHRGLLRARRGSRSGRARSRRPEAELTVERIGVVGAGTMGAGIAQLACLGGYEATIQDPVPQALEAGAERVVESLDEGREARDVERRGGRGRAVGGCGPPRTSPGSPAATS